MVVEWLCKRREGGNTQKLVNAVNEIHKKKRKDNRLDTFKTPRRLREKCKGLINDKRQFRFTIAHNKYIYT